MKKFIIGFIAFSLFAVGGILVFGQREGGKMFGGRGFSGGHPFLKMAEKLNLSEEQKTQIKTILEDAKTRIKPLMETIRANHQAIEQLGKDGVYNESEVTRLANAQAETTKQLIIEKEKTKAAIFAVLTPEQRTQAEQMKSEMKERFKDRFKKRFGGGENIPNGTEE
jgi:Spy/CpxP family protein refolding chaperone